MRHPEFKLLPWGVLALIMPGLAFLAAQAYDRSPQANHEYIIAILLSTLAAGNAYVIAIAGGRLGNAVLSIPVGALMGFITVPALSCHVVFVGYMVLFCLGGMFYALEYLMHHVSENFTLNALQLVGASVFFGLLGVTCLMLAGAGLPATSPWAAVICYPFVMSAAAAAMVVRSHSHGVPEGFLAGFRAALIGVLCGAIVLPIMAIVLHTVGGLDFNGPGALILALGYLIICNYFTLRAMFPTLLRVRDERPALKKAEKPVVLATGDATTPLAPIEN
jgi:hypothetical protein